MANKRLNTSAMYKVCEFVKENQHEFDGLSFGQVAVLCKKILASTLRLIAFRWLVKLPEQAGETHTVNQAIQENH